MHPDPRRIIPVVLIVGIGIFSWWYLNNQRASTENGPLTASGTIEATQVRVASELGGRVLEILAKEGQAVDKGQALVYLDDRLLQAQLAQARAALGQAQANYDLVAAGPTAEQRRAAISASRFELTNAQHALDTLIEEAPLVAAQTYQTVASLDQARDKAQQYWDNLNAGSEQVDIDAAWAQVVMAKDRLEDAEEDFDPYDKKDPDNLTRAVFQAKLADAQRAYDNLVERYNNLVGKANQYEMALAQADLKLLEARLQDALREYAERAEGPDPDDLELVEARLDLASANLALAEAKPAPEQLAVAQAQVDNAEAALQVIQTQIEKMTISSPADGVALARSVEPGEVILPGSALITLAQLDNLTITVYVPEDRYGEISLGQSVRVSVDSFPGEIYDAVVVRIADQAEFTPRNVQTEEGRRTTVYAIELAVSNPDGELKPGMPVDVTFGN